jgi:Fe-S oxidoreductase
VNQLRFAQIAETKVSTVVVACPYCPIMLRDAANHAKRDDFEILDLAEIVAKSIRQKMDHGAKEGARPEVRG